MTKQVASYYYYENSFDHKDLLKGSQRPDMIPECWNKILKDSGTLAQGQTNKKNGTEEPRQIFIYIQSADTQQKWLYREVENSLFNKWWCHNN